MATKKYSNIVSLIVLGLLIFSSLSFLLVDTGGSLEGSIGATRNNRILSFQSAGLTNQSSVELGYGPSSLAPVTKQIPIYTVNDQLWIESLAGSQGLQATLTSSILGTLASASVSPGTINLMYTFGPQLASQTLTLLVTVYCSNSSGCPLQYQYPIQFVNTSNSTIGSLSTHYALNNGTLSISFASPDLSNTYNIQQCPSNSSSSVEVDVPLPNSFGNGYIGITGDPNTTSATVQLHDVSATTSFAFSFELLANYTSMLSTQDNTGGVRGYTNSELEVASSSSVVVDQSTLSTSNTTLNELMPLRIGRYALVASFDSASGTQTVETPVLIKSPFASSWFWLGSCSQLSSISPLFTSKVDLSGSPGTWPKYLYLMYRILPGIESYLTVPLGLDLNRVRFVTYGNNELPSNIQVSLIQGSSSSGISDVEIGNNGIVYLITNGAYPMTASFDLSFGGKNFSWTTVVLLSSYSEVIENIPLGVVQVQASEGGAPLSNASAVISSINFGSQIIIFTDKSGLAQILVPPGNYTIYVRSGTHTSSTFQEAVSGDNTYNIPVSFQAPTDYMTYLVWIVSIITVIGAVGNLWFWLAKKRIRRNLH